LIFKYDDSKNHKISLHSFRAFFETQASNTHGLEYAHALIGHSGYLEQYYRLSEEDRLEKYIELEPKLTIGEDFRNGIKIQKLEIEKSELGKIKKQMFDERILTLKMIGEAIKDPKKFQEKLENLDSKC